MKKRSSQISDFGEEEEEGQSSDRKLNLRKRKCVNYWDHDGKEDDGEEEEEEENYNQMPSHKGDKDLELWPVTCGTKEGWMDVQKLANSKECIRCEGRWFTPPVFEDFAGKGSSKKWKFSIYSDGKPLQHWFDEDLLFTKGYLKKGTKTFKKKGQTFHKNEDESAHNLRQHDSLGDCVVLGVSEADTTEDSEDEDVSVRQSSCKSWVLRTEKEKERVDDRNEGDYMNSPEEKEDDKLDQDEMEDNRDVLDDPKDLCAPKEPDPRLIISTPEKLALQMKTTVILERISLKRSHCQTTNVEHPPKDEEKRYGDSEINYCGKEKDSKTEELLEISEPEDSEEPVGTEMVDVATNTSPQQQLVNGKIHESLRFSAAPLSIPGQSTSDNHTDVSSFDQIKSQTMAETRRVPDSVCAHLSDKVETSASGVLAGSDVDTVDLDQLQRETLKMQLEASRLQKEYYTLKLQLLKVKMKTDRFNSIGGSK